MNPPQQALQPKRSGVARIERVVLGFVLLALATLVAVPVLVNRRVTTLREDIQVSEPARTEVTLLQFSLVREMAALSEVLLTGDPSAEADYDQAYQQEDSIFRRLDGYAEQLGPEVVAKLAEVREQARVWHTTAADAEDLLESARSGEARRRRERRLFEDLLETTRQLDEAILRRTEELRGSIAAAERVGLTLTFALGFLALIAGAAATLLAGRSRRFALESEHRRREAEIALERLARAAEVRERLLQGITHDVKNPLGAAKGYAELLALGVKAPISPEQVPLVNGVQRSVDGALAIIADLLDVARADSGRLSVRRVEADLNGVVGEAVEEHRGAAEAVGHVLRFDRPTGALRVHTDPTRVRQVLQNLLSNAIKYTPAPGVITVVTQLRSEGGDAAHDRSWAVVRVTDTGPGIPPEAREEIFDEFARLDEQGTVQGHGLGLAIARRIARLLGGELRAEDPADTGANFVLLLPLRGHADVPAASET